MNDKELHKLIEGSLGVKVQLPRHRDILRSRLLDQHAHQQTQSQGFRGTFVILSEGVSRIMNKNIIKLSAGTFAVALLLVGIVTFSGLQSPASAAQLVEAASSKVQQMSPAEVAKIESQHQQDLEGRLAEARSAKGLRVLPSNEFASWGGAVAKQDPSIKTQLTYNDVSNHRIVISLDSNNQPVEVYDFDSARSNGSEQPANQ